MRTGNLFTSFSSLSTLPAVYVTSFIGGTEIELPTRAERWNRADEGCVYGGRGGWKCSLFSVLYGDIKSGLQFKILNHGSRGSFILKSWSCQVCVWCALINASPYFVFDFDVYAMDSHNLKWSKRGICQCQSLCWGLGWLHAHPKWGRWGWVIRGIQISL